MAPVELNALLAPVRAELDRLEREETWNTTGSDVIEAVRTVLDKLEQDARVLSTIEHFEAECPRCKRVSKFAIPPPPFRAF